MVDNLKVQGFEEPENKVGTFESVLSGIASGLIKIPEGVISLGASLIDLGAGTNNAAKVEQWFDDINPFDEAAEATTAGKITETLVNLGIPGGIAFTKGASLANAAIKGKKAKKYFGLRKKGDLKGLSPAELRETRKIATTFNKKEKFTKYGVAAFGSGVAEGVFVADVEKVGTFGDMLGGPTKLDRTEDYDPGREILNRVKFGTEGALFSGVIGGTGAAIKKLASRNKNLARSDDAMDNFLDKFAGKLRARSQKDPEFFRVERQFEGIKAVDVNVAQQTSRAITKEIDKMFPFLKTAFDSTAKVERKQLLKELNDVLLSGKPGVGVKGGVSFGKMDKELSQKLYKKLKSKGLNTESIKNVFGQMNTVRSSWEDMFSFVGKNMDDKSLKEFKSVFGDKFKSFLGSNYEIFQNKSLLPWLNYKPTKQLIGKMKTEIIKQAEMGGNKITPETAEKYVNEIIKSARLPNKKSLAMGETKSPAAIFKLPKYLANNSVLNDVDSFGKFKSGYVSLDDLTPAFKESMEELFGKQNNIGLTILGGTERLSLITRSNQYYQTLALQSDELVKKAIKPIAEGGEGLSETQAKKKYKMFFEDEDEALNVFGSDNLKQISFKDQTPDSVLAGLTNPLDGLYTTKGMADAVTGATNSLISNDSALGYTLNNFILFPKATSQIAKTILSPLTHVRNFISAGAFATANGIIPNSKAFSDAYKTLQIPLKGAGQFNDFYNKLTKLGVVNSNVQVGDLRKLFKEIEFMGDNVNPNNIMAKLQQIGSKGKKFGEDLYTAEDDFWKIATYISERSRLDKAYKKVGLKRNADQLDEEAADIVRNNVPNYAYVSDFVKGLRKFPLGNFVSFPAEIMRTGTNIVRRALKEINYEETLSNGQIVKPLKNIGLQRLVGFGVTTSAVPYAAVEGAKALYNVTEEEMEALRRYVPSWSKNSTLIPIRDKKTGKLKYIDYSRTNAYDTLIRPIQTVLNSVQSGRTDEDGITNDFISGIFESTKEIANPFISESIWTEAATDILVRGGRTREGSVLYTDQTPAGEKVSAIIKHLVKSQTPGSVSQFKRIGLSISDKEDKYGKGFEVGDELAGLVGFRVIQVDPERAINFKIAEFQRGIRNSRREFTSKLLKGGSVSPGDIVERYQVANKAAYKVKQEMMKDYFGALRLGARNTSLLKSFEDRGANKELDFMRTGKFRPLEISDNVIKKFQENSQKIGEANPYVAAAPVISSMLSLYSSVPLGMKELPSFPNPFENIELPANDTSYFQQINSDPSTITEVAGSTIPIENQNKLGTTNNATINSFGQIVAI